MLRRSDFHDSLTGDCVTSLAVMAEIFIRKIMLYASTCYGSRSISFVHISTCVIWNATEFHMLKKPTKSSQLNCILKCLPLHLLRWSTVSQKTAFVLKELGHPCIERQKNKLSQPYFVGCASNVYFSVSAVLAPVQVFRLSTWFVSNPPSPSPRSSPRASPLHSPRLSRRASPSPRSSPQVGVPNENKLDVEAAGKSFPSDVQLSSATLLPDSVDAPHRSRSSSASSQPGNSPLTPHAVRISRTSSIVEDPVLRMSWSETCFGEMPVEQFLGPTTRNCRTSWLPMVITRRIGMHCQTVLRLAIQILKASCQHLMLSWKHPLENGRRWTVRKM